MMSILKNKIKELRQINNLSQDELATKVSVRRETISRLEACKYNPSLTLAIDIAKVFKLPIEDIFYYVD